MSQENVNLVLGLMPASDVDIAPGFRAPIMHPDFQCTAALFGSVTSYGGGTDSVRAFWLDWLAPSATYRTETEQAIDLGDRILQFGLEFGRRKGSREEVEGKNAALWSFRDGKVVRFDACAGRGEALKAVGLSE